VTGSRAEAMALRVAIGAGIWWLIADAGGIVEDLGELGRGHAWLPLAPLAVAVLACRWAFGSAAWGAVAWAAAVAATVGTSRLQAWCIDGDSDLSGAGVVGGAGGPAAVLGGYTLLALCAITAAARARGGEGHRIVSTTLLFAGAVVAAMVVALGPRGQPVDWAVSLGALAAYPALVAAAAGMAVVGRGLARAPAQRPVCGWSLVNTACGYGIFVLSCLLMPFFALIALVAGSQRRRLIRAGMRVWMRMVFGGTPTTAWRASGDLVALERARIVVANHESILDILAACALPGTRNLLAKTWVFRAPFLGVAARAAGVLNVDRLDPDDFLGGGLDLLGQEGLFVFPEGRRARDGVIARFRLGAFALAERGGEEVLPVAMAGGHLTATPGAMWIHPGDVRSVALPPMRRAEDEAVRGFAERVRAAVGEAAMRERRALVALPRIRLNRGGWPIGLPPRMRAAARAEERSGAPAAAGALAGAEGDWWLIGCGAGPIALALRFVSPWSRFVAVDSDEARLVAASFLWLRTGDEIAAEPLPPLERLAGILCLLPADDALAADARAKAEAAKPPLVLVREADATAWAEALPGYDRATPAGGLIAFTPRPSPAPAP
jgi:1-acyl-sn-glycerol-3-phosphate acyltransferase